MKRLRPSSYSDDDDEDWERLPRRSHPHPHSSADRDLRPPRKRFDPEPPESFPDRRRPSSSASPSFSRRDFPKGFRSERERSRPPAGAWRRSSSTLRDFPEDRSTRERSRESPTPCPVEPRKPEPRSGSSDVEEGEFEPDPLPETKASVEAGGKDRNMTPNQNMEANEDCIARRKPSDEKFTEKCPTESQVVADPAVTAAGKDAIEKMPAIEESSTSPALRSEVIEKGEPVKEGVGDRGDDDLLAVAEVAMEDENLIVADVEDDKKEGNGLDVARDEVEGLQQVAKVGESGVAEGEGEVAGEGLERAMDMVTLGLLTSDGGRDKGKAPAISPSNEGHSLEENDTMEGSSNRGFELVFHSDVMKLDRMNTGGIVIGKPRDERPEYEPLDLSLGLPGISSNPLVQKPNPKPSSPQRTMSYQSLASSFQACSEDFTTSISFSGSQTFVHNPSCSFQQNNSMDFEHSVHSRPIFHAIDQNANGTVWQGQPSNEVKLIGESVSLYPRIHMNGNISHHSGNSAAEPPHPKSNGPIPQPDHLRRMHSMHSHDTHEYSKENKTMKKERSSNNIFRSEAREKEHVLNGGGLEKFLWRIVSEPLQLINRQIQDMKEHTISSIKEALSEILVNKDRHDELLKLQEALSRSDLSFEILSSCHRVLLEILVSIKTGLRDFLGSKNSISSSDLVEVFLNNKCKNLACKSNIPVDDCDCKVCSQKNGFCSSCMCLICSKFDMASNTCSWVGCDVCLHWCHTDCGLRDLYIKNGRSNSGAPGTTEMQFHCLACDHTSEMFGFVKDVFVQCAVTWDAETLVKELEYVRRIFSGSADIRGKRLQEVAIKLLQKLENKSNLREVYDSIMEFLAESDPNLSTNQLAPSKDILQRSADGNGMNSAVNNATTNGGNCVTASAREAIWKPCVPVENSYEKPALPPSFSMEKNPDPDVPVGNIQSMDHDHLKSPRIDISSSGLPTFDYDKSARRNTEAEFRSSERKTVLDDLDNFVKFKQEEAKMYQSRADEARREADGLKRIAIAKSEKIDEEYSNRLAKLRFYEAEERQRQKMEELQALEHAQNEYFRMKTRMEAEIKNLLLKMEAVKHNLRT